MGLDDISLFDRPTSRRSKNYSHPHDCGRSGSRDNFHMTYFLRLDLGPAGAGANMHRKGRAHALHHPKMGPLFTYPANRQDRSQRLWA